MKTQAAGFRPFFARYLENQFGARPGQTFEARSERGGLPDSFNRRGGFPGSATLKFPSDGEDGGTLRPWEPGGGLTTMKAPSDSDEGSFPGPGGGFDQTMKFPSDGEDGGVGKPGDDPWAVTMKAPSDSDEGGIPKEWGARTMKFPSDGEDGGTTFGTNTLLAKLDMPRLA